MATFGPHPTRLQDELMIFTPTLSTESELANAADYRAWSKAAQALDKKSGMASWRASDESDHFDFHAIRARLERLTTLADADDVRGLLFALNEGIHGNMDGMGHERLYQKARFGTKKLIEDYVNAVVDALNVIAKSRAVTLDERRDFFRRAQHCYGRSALLMSGSGAYLFFHIGVVKALWSEGILPSILSGASGGSIVAAVVCTRRDSEVGTWLDSGVLANHDGKAERGAKPKRMVQDDVRERLATLIPDLTFQEAYEISGKHLNVSVAPAEKHQNGRLLNAIASPNVLVREAVLASCAVPGIYPPVMLMARDAKGRRVPYQPDRRWVDGSVTHDVPTKRLERLYGVNHHIVSQANPIALPFATDMRKQKAPLEAIQHATMMTFKAWLNANMMIFQKPLAMVPTLNSLANLTLSIVNQDYTGDINIVRPAKFWSPSKLLSDLDQDEIDELIESGMRNAWPRVEMVRTQTAISRALEAILARIDKGGDDGTGHRSRAMKRAVR
jgi:TAG lipase / steryl ester hydrolase / phospholipase A2 / LPA acyltransferase